MGTAKALKTQEDTDCIQTAISHATSYSSFINASEWSCYEKCPTKRLNKNFQKTTMMTPIPSHHLLLPLSFLLPSSAAMNSLLFLLAVLPTPPLNSAWIPILFFLYHCHFYSHQLDLSAGSALLLLQEIKALTAFTQKGVTIPAA